jgi:hypothetical protein
MDYVINVPAAGSYRLDFRVASTVSTGVLELRKGSTVLTSVSIPNTGGAQVWQTVSASATLSAGSQTLRVYGKAGTFSLNWFELSPSTGVSAAGMEEQVVSGRSMQEQVQLYPNPARDYFVIETTNGDKIERIEMFNSLGRMNTIITNETSVQVSTNGLLKGILILRIKTTSSVLLKKMIIE